MEWNTKFGRFWPYFSPHLASWRQSLASISSCVGCKNYYSRLGFIFLFLLYWTSKYYNIMSLLHQFLDDYFSYWRIAILPQRECIAVREQNIHPIMYTKSRHKNKSHFRTDGNYRWTNRTKSELIWMILVQNSDPSPSPNPNLNHFHHICTSVNVFHFSALISGAM